MRLRGLRVRRGLSQRDLVADGAISASYVSLLEAGSRVPTLEVVHQLARVLQVRPRELAGESWPDDAFPTTPVDAGLVVSRLLVQSALAAGDLADALAHARDAHDSATEPTAVIETGMALQRVLGLAGEPRQRLAVLDDVVKAAEEAALPAVLLTATIDLATACHAVGELCRARTLLDEAVQALAGSPLAGTAEEVRLHTTHIRVLCELDETVAALELITPLLAAAAAVDQPATTGRAHWTAAVAFGRADKRAEALAHLELAHDALTDTMPVRDLLRFCADAAAIHVDCGGDLAAARELIAEARGVARLLGLSPHRDSLAARYELAVGNPAAAVRICAAVLERGEVTGYELLRTRKTLALAAEAVGEVAVAVEQLRILAADAEEEGVLPLAVYAWKRLESLRSA
ncbi:hypothetical protein Acsp05_60630 [Actinokineospora sp. NBRC 105648]|nr:hypothetical protein Acsp05_60630 [Actinokineospora sp. NBRC 105648]